MNLSLLDIQFLALLVGVVALRAVVPARFQALVGVLASIVLIGLASVPTLLFIGGVALLWVYPVALLIDRAKRKGGPDAGKTWFVVGAVGLLAIVVAYKFLRLPGFTVPFLTGSSFSSALISVLGLSYLLFKALGVLYMHHLTDVEEKSPLAILYFALFPPTITSGPMQKYLDFRKQLAAPLPLSVPLFREAAYRITLGFFRKLVLAYLLDIAITSILAGGPLQAWDSACVLALMCGLLYFDFAGYCDIAIGFGLLLGIRVPENFKSPFTSTTITEFWRNWHVTLADSYRDLVFIPAGGMRLGGLRASLLAFAIMFLCGLWHGLALPFIIWGTYHGLFLYLEGVTGSRPMSPGKRHEPVYWRKVAWTNMRFAIGCLFFLPSNAAFYNVLRGFTQWS